MTTEGVDDMRRIEGQNRAVLEMLRQGPMTARDAALRLDCLRLAARIYDLRTMGHEIASELIEGKDGARLARYHLVREANAGREVA
jgi:hypothetical protein